MTLNATDDAVSNPVPEARLLRITLQRKIVTVSRWSAASWEISAVEPLPGDAVPADIEHGEERIVAELELRLHRDQAEEYRHNLGGREPKLAVICSNGPDDTIEPRTLSISEIDTATFLETDDLVLSCPLPASLFDWLAAWVALVPLPEPRRKGRHAPPQDGHG